MYGDLEQLVQHFNSWNNGFNLFQQIIKCAVLKCKLIKMTKCCLFRAAVNDRDNSKLSRIIAWMLVCVSKK